MFCKYCGADIPDNSKFCPECGKKLGEESTSDRQDYFTQGPRSQENNGSGYDPGREYSQNPGSQYYNGRDDLFDRPRYNNDPYYSTESGDQANEPGRGSALASMILGIVSVLCMFTGGGAIVSVICGIIGLVLANSARKAGYTRGMRTAGFVLSIIGIVLGAIVFIFAVLVIGAFVSVTNLGYM